MFPSYDAAVDAGEVVKLEEVRWLGCRRRRRHLRLRLTYLDDSIVEVSQRHRRQEFDVGVVDFPVEAEERVRT